VIHPLVPGKRDSLNKKERQMRKTAIIVGALFWISNLATLVGNLISGAIPNAYDSLTSMYPQGIQIMVGTLIAHINDAAIIGYAVLLFPVLKRYGEGLALGYVAFKLLKATLLVVSRWLVKFG
jgi:Domain of unknown function (DUF4386)